MDWLLEAAPTGFSFWSELGPYALMSAFGSAILWIVYKKTGGKNGNGTIKKGIGSSTATGLIAQKSMQKQISELHRWHNQPGAAPGSKIWWNDPKATQTQEKILDEVRNLNSNILLFLAQFKSHCRLMEETPSKRGGEETD